MTDKDLLERIAFLERQLPFWAAQLRTISFRLPTGRDPRLEKLATEMIDCVGAESSKYTVKKQETSLGSNRPS